MPTLIVHGDQDASAPIDITGRKTAALIDGATLMIYPGCRHGLYASDHDALNADILAFIAGRPLPGLPQPAASRDDQTDIWLAGAGRGRIRGMGVVLWGSVCAVFLLIAGSVIRRVRVGQFRAGVYVNGNVIDRTRHTLDLGGEHCEIRFGYAVEGEYFHATQAVNRLLYDSYRTGARIGVRYLPGKPTKARIDATL